jgi:uncharacterized protein with GYD domain
MATFFMFGRYTNDSLGKISVERTRQAHTEIVRLGGQVKSIYALLGEYDLVMVVDLPRMTDAMKVSITLNQLMGISFFTAAAVPIEEFDQLMGEL